MKRPDLPPTARARAEDPARGTGRVPRTPARAEPERDKRTVRDRLADRAVQSRTRRPQSPERAARAEIRAARRQRRRAIRADLRRFTANRRRRRLIVLSSLGVIAALFIGVFGVAYSPLMAITTIRVVGTSQLNADTLAQALAGQKGTPLPLVSSDAIKKALSAFPAVQSFSTESIPPSTLIVRIVERTPVGSVPTSTGWNLVDSAGVVLASEATPRAGVARLDVPDTVTGAFQTVARMLLTLPPALRAEVTEAGASSDVNAWFRLSSGTKVVWGDANNDMLKLRVLQVLKAKSPGASLINVSAPNSPYTR